MSPRDELSNSERPARCSHLPDRRLSLCIVFATALSLALVVVQLGGQGDGWGLRGRSAPLIGVMSAAAREEQPAGRERAAGSPPSGTGTALASPGIAASPGAAHLGPGGELPAPPPTELGAAVGSGPWSGRPDHITSTGASTEAMTAAAASTGSSWGAVIAAAAAPAPAPPPPPSLPVRPPWRIAHRGASSELPEHTREAYERAVEEGADFIECDVVLTSDLVPHCRHEPNLATSTDAPDRFPHRLRTYDIDGVRVSGIFSVDLTATEMATLRAVQPWPFRNQSYNGQFKVATLADFLEVATSANRSVGIYPETKHPSWTNSLPPLAAARTTLEDILLQALAAAGFTAPLGSVAWRRRPVFLQSFEAASLKYLAARTLAPTVLLLGEWEGWVAPDSGLSLRQLTADESLAEIAEWAAAVGPDKDTLVEWRPGEQAAAAEEEEAGQGQGGARQRKQPQQEGGRGRYVSTGLVERFHAHGLQVHAYTLRPESRFRLPHLANVSDEYVLLLAGAGGEPGGGAEGGEGEAGGDRRDRRASPSGSGGSEGVVAVDGVFTDHLPSLNDWMAARGWAGPEGAATPGRNRHRQGATGCFKERGGWRPAGGSSGMEE